MKGDFTRFGFDSRKHFSAVLQQQGRVSLDADGNQATAVLLHQLRTLTRDLFGAAGGPRRSGFALHLDASGSPLRLWLGPGHYYVDGILCENEQWTDYAHQPDRTPAPAQDGSGGDVLLAWLAQPSASGVFWVYLDVWERHITWIEDDSIREPALGGPDTCTRVKVVWQVKALPWDRERWGDPHQDGQDNCTVPLDSLHGGGQGRLAARTDPGPMDTDPCTVNPDAAYRGPENHLYRVEIHRAGAAGRATFKWSRDNGSIATRWLGVAGGGDAPSLVAFSTRGLAAGDWVELSHDALDLAGRPGQLVRVAAVEGDQLALDAASIPGGALMAWSETLSNPKLRRWDHRGSDLLALDEGAVPVAESSTRPWLWLDLEDGIQIAFEAGGQYRSGDYWLIPARVASQDIEWPAPDRPDAMQPPQGIRHHYAPLGVLALADDGVQIMDQCRNCLSLNPGDCLDPETPPMVEPALATEHAQRASPKSAATERKSKPSTPRKRKS